MYCWEKLLSKKVVREELRIILKIAQAYELLGELEHAYYTYWQARKLDPRNLNLIGKIGEIAYVIENYRDTVEAFRIIIADDPFDPIAWHNLGLAYYSLGLHDQAIDCLKISLDIEEESAETWYNISTIYAENYLINEALVALEKALLLEPDLRQKAQSEVSFYALTESNLFKYMIES